MESRADIEQLLKDGSTVQTAINGYSMYPLLVPDRDSVILAPLESYVPRRGDVVLYRRDGSILVLHRICKVRQDGVYMVGDNQTEVEGPLRQDQIRGKMVAFIRKGKHVSIGNIPYRIYACIWLWMRPVRHKVAVAVHLLKEFGKNRHQ